MEMDEEGLTGDLSRRVRFFLSEHLVDRKSTQLHFLLSNYTNMGALDWKRSRVAFNAGRGNSIDISV